MSKKNIPENKSVLISGTVLRGSHNVFSVHPDLNASGDNGNANNNTATGINDINRLINENALECRLKGKVLKGADDFYNPIAPGDRVRVEINPAHPGAGMIVALEERKNFFSRFNQKGNCTQLIAANIDQVLCLTTLRSPPFRPRFLDRILLQADVAGIPALIVRNKTDLDPVAGDPEAAARLDDFRRLGYAVIEVSAVTGKGMDDLRRHLCGKRSVLTGHSGTGKSSLINALLPGTALKTGAVNEKYDRGNHTTALAFMLKAGNGADDNTWIIDTPGIRRFVPDGIDTDDVVSFMREFAPFAGKCFFGISCSHRHETGCKIREAVASGAIHEDRYTGFLRIIDELARKNDAE